VEYSGNFQISIDADLVSMIESDAPVVEGLRGMLRCLLLLGIQQSSIRIIQTVKVVWDGKTSVFQEEGNQLVFCICQGNFMSKNFSI